MLSNLEGIQVSELFPNDPSEVAFWRYTLLHAIKEAQFGNCIEMYWLFSDRWHIGSFKWICEQINYCPRRTRKGIVDHWETLRDEFFGMSLNGGRARWARERVGMKYKKREESDEG